MEWLLGLTHRIQCQSTSFLKIRVLASLSMQYYHNYTVSTLIPTVPIGPMELIDPRWQTNPAYRQYQIAETREWSPKILTLWLWMHLLDCWLQMALGIAQSRIGPELSMYWVHYVYYVIMSRGWQSTIFISTKKLICCLLNVLDKATLTENLAMVLSLFPISFRAINKYAGN